jgi:hypothetical protein
MTDGLKPFCNECESEKDVAINKANEKNWYNSLDWYYETKFGHIVPDLPRIVAEAERRGQIEALEWLRESASGGGSWRRMIEMRLNDLSEPPKKYV